MADLAVKIDTVAEPVEHNNVISFSLIRNIAEQDAAKPKSTRKGGKLAGQDSEVYAFRTTDEIKAIIDVLDKHIDDASNNDQRKIAWRNKLLFIVGINIGIRASDLRTLKWSFFFNKQKDGTLKFNDFYKIQPKKTKKHGKFVKLFFNETIKKIISIYIEEYPIGDLDEYLFFSRKGNNPISVNSMYHIIKDVAVEAGIEQNVGSHSLRKTFGYWVWHNAKDKEKMLVILSQIYNHSDVSTTRKYIGLTNDEMEDTFNSLNLGLDLI